MQFKTRLLALITGAATMMLLASEALAAGGFPQPTICTRSCWNARAAKSTPTQMASLNRAIVHHTAGAGDFNTTSQSQSAALVRAIQNYHMDVNGWADVGYHFMTCKNGFNFEGRVGSMSSLPRGAHDGVNTNSFGFNVMGYMHTPYNHAPTAAQRSSLYDLIAWRMPNPYTGFGSSTYNGRTVGFLAGHRDVSATACPGDLMYQYMGNNWNAGEARVQVNNRITGGQAVTVIVDNTSAGFAASSNWWTANATSGYYGTNYHVRATAAVSDPAAWTVNLPSSGSYAVTVRYTSGTNRASAAPYIVYHNGGQTTVNVDQTANGGSWRSVGTYNFAAGSSVKVRLSCWTTSGDVVIADAVRFVKQ